MAPGLGTALVLWGGGGGGAVTLVMVNLSWLGEERGGREEEEEMDEWHRLVLWHTLIGSDAAAAADDDDDDDDDDAGRVFGKCIGFRALVQDAGVRRGDLGDLGDPSLTFDSLTSAAWSSVDCLAVSAARASR